MENSRNIAYVADIKLTKALATQINVMRKCVYQIIIKFHCFQIFFVSITVKYNHADHSIYFNS